MSSVRVEITSYNKIVAQELFASFDEAQDFVAWWMNHPELPTCGATTSRADREDKWRRENPLPVELVDWRSWLIGGGMSVKQTSKRAN